MGVVDYLQNYTEFFVYRPIQSFLQRKFQDGGRHEVACVEPKRYAARMKAGLQYMFGSLRCFYERKHNQIGSLRFYEHEHNKNYIMRHREVVAKYDPNGVKGRDWLQMMTDRGAEAHPTTLTRELYQQHEKYYPRSIHRRYNNVYPYVPPAEPTDYASMFAFVSMGCLLVFMAGMKLYQVFIAVA